MRLRGMSLHRFAESPVQRVVTGRIRRSAAASVPRAWRGDQ